MTSLLNWLGETPAQKASNATPGYLSMGMAGKVFLFVLQSTLHLDANILQSWLWEWYAPSYSTLRNVLTEQTYMPLFLPPPPNQRAAAPASTPLAT